MTRFFVVLALAFLFALPAAAGPRFCEDWTGSLARPALHPELTAAAGAFDGTILYTIGDALRVVETADPAAPVVLGALELPAAAADLLVAGPTVYVAAGPEVLAVDVSDPATPTVRARYAAASSIPDLAWIDGALVARDEASRLHVLADGGGPDLAPLAVHDHAGRHAGLTGMAWTGRFLVLLDAEGGFTPVDLTDPAAPLLLARCRSNTVLGAVGIAAGPDRIFALDVDVLGGTFDLDYAHHLVRYRIEPDGPSVPEQSLEVDTDRFRVAGDHVFLDAGGFLGAGGAVRVLAAATLEHLVTLEQEGVVVGGGARLAMVSGTAGLALWEQPDLRAVTPLLRLGAHPDARSVPPYVVTSRTTVIDNGSGGGVTRSFDFAIYDLEDPGAPVLGGEGHRSGSGDHDFPPPSFALDVAGDGWIALATYFGAGTWFEFLALPGGEAFGALDVEGGLWWMRDADRMYVYERYQGGLRLIDIDPGTAVTVLATIPLPAGIDQFLQPDPDLLIARTGTRYTWYDTSDPAAPVELGSAEMAAIPGAHLWRGRMLTFVAGGDELLTADFSVPGQLARSAPRQLDDRIRRLDRYGDGFVMSGPAGFRIGGFCDDGAPYLYTAVVPGDFRQLLTLPGLVYARSDHGLHLFDVAEPDHPRHIGRGTGTGDGLAVVSDCLVAGNGVYPLDCRSVVRITANEGDELPDAPPVFGIAGIAATVAPNPFNPRTTLAFTTSREQRIGIAVHDLRGRRVAALADRVFAAGPHTISWQGCDDAGRAVPTGAYFFRFTTARGVQARKALLLR